MHQQVINQVVENDICIGCGVCAGVCPSRLLSMTALENGDLAVAIDGECPSACDLCLTVCPFVDQNPNEDELAAIRFAEQPSIKKDDSVGYFSNTYVGFSKDSEQRQKSASGGVVTQLLADLLNNGEVDSVFCVGLGDSQKRLFEFVEITNAADLLKCASSRYYPVDAEKVVSELQKKGSTRNVVITGLPCTLKAISLAMRRLPRVRNQVKYMVGLVCGLLPNFYYTQYLASLSVGEGKEVVCVDYRNKKGTKLSPDFNFIAQDEKGDWGRPLSFFDVVSTPYTSGMFQHNSCNYCDDVFAEVADLTVMDAWLPEYLHDTDGTSLLVVRSAAMEQALLASQKAGSLVLTEISIDKIKKSQHGVLLKKRERLASRLSWAKKAGIYTPVKRVEPALNLSWLKEVEISAKQAIQVNSKSLWRSGIPPEKLLKHQKVRIPLLIINVFSIRDRLIYVLLDPRRIKNFLVRKIKLNNRVNKL